MILYNVEGQALRIDYWQWQAALVEAMRWAWKPRGTLRPPVSLDRRPQWPWDGNYTVADGQEVARDDARALAEALVRACQASITPSPWQDLARFLSGAGFLICPEAASATESPGRGLSAVERVVPLEPTASSVHRVSGGVVSVQSRRPLAESV